MTEPEHDHGAVVGVELVSAGSARASEDLATLLSWCYG